jgi:putative transposase
MKAYKFRIYPTKAQVTLLEKQMRSCAFVYNYMLNYVIESYKVDKAPFRKFDLSNKLPELKTEYPFLKNVHSQVLRNAPERINTAFKGFFRRVKAGGEDPGFPRFKSASRYNSITYPQYGNGCSLDKKLNLSKIGAIKIVGLRELQGKPKTITIKRAATGKWFASISCETPEIIKKPLDNSSKTIGIDLGLESFLTDSNGNHIENPRFFRKEEKSLAKAQSKRDKTPKCTELRKKRSKVVARIHERISNKRDDFCHQLSRKFVDKYDLICMEKLEIQDM